MPSLLDIRRRIRSVKNTQQLTKAMKMVSAAKLRRAQERVLSARPYANQLKSVLGSLAGKLENIEHPLLEVRPEEKILAIIVTADRGLCGGFNSNIIKAGQTFLLENTSNEKKVFTVGRKGRDFFKRRTVTIVSEYVNFFSKLDVAHARDISKEIVEMYTNADVDAVYLIYNEFKSVIQQRIVVEKLLPLGGADVPATGTPATVDYIFEQPPQEILNRLLPRYVEIQVFRALLESAAAEHGGRMAAMDAASRNAGEMIDLLTLNMNRVRQAAITREIIEVVSGAGAQ
jgi:F-type H+-transporting ATPase subunit gamma